MVKINELLARRLQVSNLTTRQFSLMFYDHLLSAATAASDLSHTLEEEEVVTASDLSYTLPPGELAYVEAELEEVVAEAGGVMGSKNFLMMLNGRQRSRKASNIFRIPRRRSGVLISVDC